MCVFKRVIVEVCVGGNIGSCILIGERAMKLKEVISERSERAQSRSCSIEISDTYVYIYICIYIYVAIRQVICACLVVRNVGGVKC